MNILAIVEAFFAQKALDIWTRLQGIFTSMLEDMAEGEAQALHDAVGQYQKDRAAGKGFGEASADALSVFFNESSGLIGTVAHKYFEAFLIKESQNQ